MFNLTESEKALLTNHLFKHQVSSFNSNPVLENEEKYAFYAKELVKNLFENIVYKEEFECEEQDTSAYQFAETFVTSNMASKIVNSTMKAFPSSVSNEILKECALNNALTLTKMWLEDGKHQLIEVEEYTNTLNEKSLEVDQELIKEKFRLFEEFDKLVNTKKDESGDVTKSLISEMSYDEKMKLALRLNAFKGALESIGFDLKTEDLNKAISREFDKNLF